MQNLKEEKSSLNSRIESLQASLKATEKSKQVTQELCHTGQEDQAIEETTEELPEGECPVKAAS